MSHGADCPYAQHSDDECSCALGAPGSEDDRGVVMACPAPDDAGECATIREQWVSGVNAPVPDCPVHGEWIEGHDDR